jgi:hypothetical protein
VSPGGYHGCVILLLLFLGCVTDPSVTPSCPHSVDAWYGGVARELLLARADGVIDHPSAEPWVNGVVGRWERHGGSFALHTRYTLDYFMHSEARFGGGWLAPCGDYEFSWSWWTQDVLQVVERGEAWEQRRGCDIEREVRSSDALVRTLATIVDEDTVWGAVTNTASPYDVTATWRSDHSASLSYAGHDGQSWYEVEEPGDGTREARFHLVYDGGHEDGGYVRTLDGAREYEFDRYPDEGEWVVMHLWWLIRYDGSGEGEVVGEDAEGNTLTCWYEWDAGSVGSYSCDDGTGGPY